MQMGRLLREQGRAGGEEDGHTQVGSFLKCAVGGGACSCASTPSSGGPMQRVEGTWLCLVFRLQDKTDTNRRPVLLPPIDDTTAKGGASAQLHVPPSTAHFKQLLTLCIPTCVCPPALPTLAHPNFHLPQVGSPHKPLWHSLAPTSGSGA